MIILHSVVEKNVEIQKENVKLWVDVVELVMINHLPQNVPKQQHDLPVHIKKDLMKNIQHVQFV